jgi:hypothetical protein
MGAAGGMGGASLPTDAGASIAAAGNGGRGGNGGAGGPGAGGKGGPSYPLVFRGATPPANNATTMTFMAGGGGLGGTAPGPAGMVMAANGAAGLAANTFAVPP